MKNLLFILLFSFSIFSLIAQTKPGNPKPHPKHGQDMDNEDTINLKVGNYKVIIIDTEKTKNLNKSDSTIKDSIIVGEEEDEKQHKEYKSWSGLDFGINGYLNADMNTKMPSGYKFLELNTRRSFSFGLNFFEQDINIVKDYFKFATGLGLEWDNYFFSNNTRLTSDSVKIYGYSDPIKFDKTKLRLSYLNLPLLLQINTNRDPKKAFHLSTGLIISYNMGAKTKMVYTLNNDQNTEKVSGDYHINPLRYGVTARIGYGNFKLFANYNLSTLFEKDDGPELYPFSVGISILSF
jgi:hypothetical protein